MFALQFQMEAALTIYGVLTVPIHVPFATMEESAMTSVGAVSVRRDSKETIVNLVNKIDKHYNHLKSVYTQFPSLNYYENSEI